MKIGLQGQTTAASCVDLLVGNDTGVERYCGNKSIEEETKAGITKEADEEKAVTLEISNEAKENYLAMQMGIQNMENAQDQGEAMQEAVNEMGKAMIIFRRIARGDKVPPRDERKLMEYDDKLYQMAKNAAMMAKNAKPKKYKSLYEDEADGELSQQSDDKSTMETGEIQCDGMEISEAGAGSETGEAEAGSEMSF